jgi:hypothetical protein
MDRMMESLKELTMDTLTVEGWGYYSENWMALTMGKTVVEVMVFQRVELKANKMVKKRETL